MPGECAVRDRDQASPAVKDCAVTTFITSPLMTDFESYDGVTPPAEWGFAFNASSGQPDAVYVGPYEFNDGTGQLDTDSYSCVIE